MLISVCSLYSSIHSIKRLGLYLQIKLLNKNYNLLTAGILFKKNVVLQKIKMSMKRLKMQNLVMRIQKYINAALGFWFHSHFHPYPLCKHRILRNFTTYVSFIIPNGESCRYPSTCLCSPCWIYYSSFICCSLPSIEGRFRLLSDSESVTL